MTPLVSNGVPTRKGEFPYIVNILAPNIVDPKQQTEYCTGAIVNEHYIITLAQCSSRPFETYQVVAGEHNLTASEGTEQVRNVSQVIVHPEHM